MSALLEKSDEEQGVMSDAINPSHYKSNPSGLECIEFTRLMGFCRGNAFKYLWRAGLKDNRQQDIEKAKWYLEDEYFYGTSMSCQYSEKTKIKLTDLLEKLALTTPVEQMSILHRIIFGEWHSLKDLADEL